MVQLSQFFGGMKRKRTANSAAIAAGLAQIHLIGAPFKTGRINPGKLGTAASVHFPNQGGTTLAIRWAKESHWEITPAVINRGKSGPSRSSCGRVLFLALLLVALFPLSAFTAQSVSLTWNPSTSSDVAGYHIYYGPANGDYTSMISVGDATNVTISGLVAGATYYFAATAYDSQGVESALSNVTSYTVPYPIMLSLQLAYSAGAPVSLSITASGTTPRQWALQSSPDLKSWTTIAQGTNSPVNVTFAVGNAPAMFFRLTGQ